jgi:hypothetical protein
MLFASSVIRKSGQWWKVVIASWAIILGAGFTGYHLTQIGSMAPDAPPVFAWVGAALSLMGLLIGCMAVRCQNCGARWIWIGMKEQVASNWVNWLAQSTCPRCHK